MQTNNFTVKEGAAELVFKNGYIYTPDSQAVEEQAVAIKDGYIVFVGESNDASKYIGSDTKVNDLGNKMLLIGGGILLLIGINILFQHIAPNFQFISWLDIALQN